MERQQSGVLSGRVPLAVVVVDGGGRVSHWSSGARRLFGPSREAAVGEPAGDLLPVAGALGALDAPAGGRGAIPHDPGRTSGLPPGPDLDVPLDAGEPYPGSGRARIHGDGGTVRDVLWWAYPLFGPGANRLLVLAADAAQVGGAQDGNEDGETVVPGFALHTEFSGADELARRMPDILPNMGPGESGRIVAQILDLGYPVLEVSRHHRVPVTPDWGVPRRPVRTSPAGAVPAQARAGHDRLPRDGHPEGRGRQRERVPQGGRGPAYEGGRRDGPHRPGREDGPGGERGRQERQDLENAAVRERLEFLNEVNRGIGATLDLARTIQEVTEAAVPRFADFAGTHLREQILAGEGFPEGPPDVRTVMHRVWVTHNDEPGRWDDTVPVGESFAFPEHTPFYQCMSTGATVLIPRIGEELGNRISAEFEKRDLRPLITGRSLLIVPLTARKVVLGFMVLMRRADRQAFDEMDTTTATELAARTALVLDNARLYTYQENTAETLQDSMLPQSLPKLPGADTATRYLPGTRLGRVGGDWFDTIKLPGSRVALVVGDVMGHGLNSAAMMGQLRTAVQTMAALDLPPAQLLRSLDDLAQRLGEHYLATCLYAVYDPVESRLTIANAGHIPPVLVRADGGTDLLDLPTGAPIGVGGVPFEEVRMEVGGGDRLVLCTDGLVEVRGRDIGDGLAALCESAAHPAASMDDACDTIIRALNHGGGDRKDDVALLMARLNGIPRDRVACWQLALDPREVRRARALTRQTLEGWGLEPAADTAELLVSEIVTNAIRHAHTRHVELRLLQADALVCEVTDDDHSLPVLLSAKPDQEGGRGLRVVSALAASWGASRTAGGKTVWFEQALTP